MQLTQKQLDVCNSPLRNQHIKIEVYDFFDKIINTLETRVINGGIDKDATNHHRRNCNIDMVVSDNFNIENFFKLSDISYIDYGGILWIDRYVKIYIGIEDLQSEDIVWFNQGKYIIDKPEQTYSLNNNIIRFNGADLMVRLSGERGGQLANLFTTIPMFQDENYTIRTRIKNAFIDVLTQLGQIKKYIIDDRIDDSRWKFLPYDINLSGSNTVYDILKQLLDTLPNWDMFFDDDGVFVLQPIPDGKEDSSFTLSQDMVIEENDTLDFNNVRNQIIVYGGVNYTSRYTENVMIDGTYLNLYFDNFTWEGLTINSKIAFRNINYYNLSNIDHISIWNGGQILEHIRVFGFEKTTIDIAKGFLVPLQVYVLRVLEGEIDNNGNLTGNNIELDLFSNIQPSTTVVNTNKDSKFYINKYLEKPNYYCGEPIDRETFLIGYKLKINDNEEQQTELENNDTLTFIPTKTGSPTNQFWELSTELNTTAFSGYECNLYFAQGRYYYTGNGFLQHSSDLINWITPTISQGSLNAQIIYWEKENTFFYVTRTNTFISTNGITFNILSIGLPTNQDIEQVTISKDGNALFIAYRGSVYKIKRVSGDFVATQIIFPENRSHADTAIVFITENEGYIFGNVLGFLTYYYKVTDGLNAVELYNNSGKPQLPSNPRQLVCNDEGNIFACRDGNLWIFTNIENQEFTTRRFNSVRDISVYNNKLYVCSDTSGGIHTINGYIFEAITDDWQLFIPNNYYLNSVWDKSFCMSLTHNDEGKTVGLFLDRENNQFKYRIGQFVKKDFLTYKIQVVSSHNLNNIIAEGLVEFNNSTQIPINLFNNDYTIHILKYDKINSKFIYQGFLNNYLKVCADGEYEVIPSDELCKQRADYELYLHSNLNLAKNVTIVPIYYLDTNKKIKYKSKITNKENEYLIKTINIPLGINDSMRISAMQLYN